jgi:hypothetical protein
VPAQVGRRARYDDLVPDAGRDLVVAPRAPIRLRCLVRVHVLDVDIVGYRHRSEHSRRPEHQDGDDHEGRDDDPRIAAVRNMGSKRVVAHVVTVPAAAGRSR